MVRFLPTFQAGQSGNFTDMKRTNLISAWVLFFLSFLFMFQAKTQSTNEFHFRILAESNGEFAQYAASNERKAVLPMNIHIPTAFSPNGDGLNDTFGPVAEGIEEMEMVIFNRWGEVVYTSRNINQRWDGTFQGKQAPMGVYGYKLVAKNADNQSMVKKGSVTLVN